MNILNTEQENTSMESNGRIQSFVDRLESMTERDVTALTSVPAPIQGGAGFSGEILARDRRQSTLSIVQRVGGLADCYKPGSIILNKEIELSDGTQPVELTILHVHKYYQEKVAYNSGVRPKIYDTEEAVKFNGGTLEWVGDEPPSYEVVLRCTVLIKKPEWVDEAFPLSHDGEMYSTCDWYIRGMAYKTVGRTLLSTIWQMSLSGLEISSLKWLLRTGRSKLNNGYTVVTPVLKNLGQHTTEFVEYVETLKA